MHEALSLFYFLYISCGKWLSASIVIGTSLVLILGISELVMYIINLETPSYLVRTDVESRIMITHWSGTGPENETDSNSVMLVVYPLNPLHLVADQWRGFSGCVMVSLWSVMNQRQTPEMMGNSRILLHWSNIDHSPVLFYDVSFKVFFFLLFEFDFW